MTIYTIFTLSVKNVFLWEDEHNVCVNNLILELEAQTILPGSVNLY